MAAVFDCVDVDRTATSLGDGSTLQVKDNEAGLDDGMVMG